MISTPPSICFSFSRMTFHGCLYLHHKKNNSVLNCDLLHCKDDGQITNVKDNKIHTYLIGLSTRLIKFFLVNNSCFTLVFQKCKMKETTTNVCPELANRLTSHTWSLKHNRVRVEIYQDE